MSFSTRLWLRDGAEEKLAKLHEAGKLGVIKIHKDDTTLFSYIDIGSEDNPLLDILPSRLVRKVTVRITIDEDKTFVRNGIYKVGCVQVVVRTEGSGGYGDNDYRWFYQEIKLSGRSWKTSQKAFRMLMTGKLKPVEDWENRGKADEQSDRATLGKIREIVDSTTDAMLVVLGSDNSDLKDTYYVQKKALDEIRELIALK